MPNENLTYILVIQDRSGSMISVRQATIDGFNEFVEGQRTGSGDAKLRLVQFDHQYLLVFDEPLANLGKLDNVTYQPRGSTALLDAIGQGITDLGNDLKALEEKDRPAKVVVVIMTDGHENASQTYSRTKVFEMIKHQESTYNWVFLYIGANQDAIGEGLSLGINAGNAMNYSSSKAGIRNSYQSASAAVNRSRGGSSIQGFTKEERTEAMEADHKK